MSQALLLGDEMCLERRASTLRALLVMLLFENFSLF